MTKRIAGGLEVAPLLPGKSFGAIVRGVNRRGLDDARVRQDFRALWIDAGVIVFEDVEGEEVQLALSRCFGDLIAHPTPETRAAHPELMTVHYEPDTGWLMDVDGEKLGNWLPWHSDLIYVDKINRGGILRPLKLPDSKGETGFIDKIAAYSALPDRLKQEIEGLGIVYKYNLDPERQKFGRTADVRIERYTPGVSSIQGRLDDYPRVVHPMVYTQLETGRKVLNVSPWFAVSIAGRETAEGDALLEEVCRHIVDRSEIYLHRWTMGQMVLWDNWRVLHSATGTPADQERWMLRTTIAGDYGLGRKEAGARSHRTDYISV